jgi:peptide/nickel transport system substrate-binding protein
MVLAKWGADYVDPNGNAEAFCDNPDDTDASTLKNPAWRSHFSDSELTAEAEAAARELDDSKRLEIYTKMQQQFQERSPFVFMLQQSAVAVQRSNTSGLSLGVLPNYTLYSGINKS